VLKERKQYNTKTNPFLFDQITVVDYKIHCYVFQFENTIYNFSQQLGMEYHPTWET